MFASWFSAKPPEYTPSEPQLRQWAGSEWIEYQAWLFHHGFVSLHEWQTLRARARAWKRGECPLFSVITPVYNTPPEFLAECLYSVQTQAYPHWEMCLVDDGSTRPETLALLRDKCADDPRLRLAVLPHNQGICAATNHAVEMARGDYVAFLDHDDRLAPDALYRVAERLRGDQTIDIVYTDRDMLSPRNLRFMHLFKPGWSPETLLSGNYLFHLLVYRRALVRELGGLRAGFEGSQDYDLILRAADRRPTVAHIPRVLYHWRQHAQSVALEHEAKAYAYQAGIRALEETLQRRDLRGGVSENPSLWRGNYRVNLESPPPEQWQVLRVERWDGFAQALAQALDSAPRAEYFIILGPGVEPLAADSLGELVAWLQLPDVAMSTGKVLDGAGRLLHAGLVHRPNGIPLGLYAGHPEETPGYMAVTASLRNIGAPHPACCAVRRDTLQRFGDLSKTYRGPHALLDLGLSALQTGGRAVYTPFARFRADPGWLVPEVWPAEEREVFAARWRDRLNAGDPYYNPWLTLELNDMGLALDYRFPENVMDEIL